MIVLSLPRHNTPPQTRPGRSRVLPLGDPSLTFRFRLTCHFQRESNSARRPISSLTANERLSVSGRCAPVPTTQRKTIPEKEMRNRRSLGATLRDPSRHSSRRGAAPCRHPIIARSNESVAKSDAEWITVTNARESVQTSRGGGANDAGIETAGEWGVFSSNAVPSPARAIVSVLAHRAIGHPLAA